MRLTSLKFISEKREAEFKKLGINSAEELVKHFPRDYLDLMHMTYLKDAYHNDVILTLCEVLNVELNRAARRPYVRATCSQGGNMFTAIWFNQPYVASKLKRGEYLFYGRVQNKYGFGCNMVNPQFEEAGNNKNLKGIIPVYPLTDGLTQRIVRAAIKEALLKVPCGSVIPYPLQKKYNLMRLEEAYYKVHCPENKEDIKRASERIALEEYFLLISAFSVIKGGRDDARIRRYTPEYAEVSDFMSRFPFAFTEGQKSAVDGIFKSLKSPRKMNLLLQGDVGSGKTAVALTAIYMAVKSGFQAVMLAPTEVLANQNAALIKRYFPEYRSECMTGSTSAAAKRDIKRALAAGEINILCGTHAVIQDDVLFKNLALAVCDEQQRFGVAHRSALSEKGEGCDVLVMSATPIPRTLSLIFYGDLDITTIKDKPKQRLPVITSVIPESKYSGMYKYVAEQAKLGNQTYFVCPKIEGDEEGAIASVTELYEELQGKMSGVRFGLLHGKMRDKQKIEVMEAFKNKEFDCLVSTTVIEVGVDVPDATTMIIYNAERFGLSQLHQLRGRVGRGDKQSYCFLLMGSDTPEARERLSVIKNSNDGFEIAEADLQLRGGGDFMGTRQSGKMLSEIKNLKFSYKVVFTAKKICDEAFSGGFDTALLVKIASDKYLSLKDIILN